MAEEEFNTQKVDGGSFILFLILILLIMGNTKTFTTHFQLLDKEVSSITQIINAFKTTADGLQGTFAASQKIKDAFV